MKLRPLAIALTALFAATSLFAAPPPAAAPAAPAPAKPAVPAVKLPPQPPDVAAPKLGADGKPNAGFIKSHESFVATAKQGKAELLFLGDSITAGWNGQKAIWEKTFGAYKPANFGIGGDRTQHVLWRIENGELEGIKPKAAVIMIGTNNSRDDSAEGIAKGVTKIVETIRAKTPATKILLLAVFPRGEKAEGNMQRDKPKQVNATIAKLDDGKHVFFLDIGSKFLQPDGTLTKEIMPDLLHLSAKGYQIWADAISPKLKELMK
jgi:lysophospholipase L1-like esterase